MKKILKRIKLRLKKILQRIELYLQRRKEKFWYVLHEDGQIEGGLVHFGDVFYVATVRSGNRKNFQIVYEKPCKIRKRK
jgi:hypothetical protein